MNLKRTLTGLTLMAAAIPAASADTANFTRILPASDNLVVNQTFILSGPFHHTPLVLFLFTAGIGLLMLFLSIMLKPETPFDMIGYIAPVPLFFSTLMSLGIDIKTSSGAGSVTQNGLTTLILIENHTVYFEWLLTIFLGVLVAVSVLNIFRIQAKKAEELVKAPD